MTKRISVGLGLANLPRDVNTEELKRFIASQDCGHVTYTLAPPTPGAIRGAALDLMLILDATGSAASIAALLWMAYEKFVAPKKTRYEDDGGIYIAIRRPDGTVMDLWIRKTHKSLELFVDEFTTKITAIDKEDDPEFWAGTVAEIEQSNIWIRQK